MKFPHLFKNRGDDYISLKDVASKLSKPMAGSLCQIVSSMRNCQQNRQQIVGSEQVLVVGE